jgi:hypothetical protein
MGSDRLRRDFRRLALAFLFTLGAISAGPSGAAAQTESYATGEIGVLGSLNRGSFTSTHAEDGAYEKIAEVEDASGNKRLEWQWIFDVAAGSSYALHVVAQATNTKQGMDHYEFYVSQGSSGWVLLGQVTQTNMTAYDWPLPAGDFSGSVTIKAVDTNQVDDPRRANQLWIDHLYVLSSGAAPTPLGDPTDLSATAVSESAIDLAWTDNANAETGFEIERKVGAGGSYGQIALVGGDVEAYSDVGLSSGTTYVYRVRAYDDAGTSGYSNVASATPQSGGGGGGATGPQTDKIIAGYFPSTAMSATTARPTSTSRSSSRSAAGPGRRTSPTRPSRRRAAGASPNPSRPSSIPTAWTARTSTGNSRREIRPTAARRTTSAGPRTR